MDRSARYAKHLTWTNFDLSSLHRPSQHALESVDGLLVGVVTVRDRHLRFGWDIKFKIATEPPDSLPSTRNRIASCPILISSRPSIVMSVALLSGRPNAESHICQLSAPSVYWTSAYSPGGSGFHGQILYRTFASCFLKVATIFRFSITSFYAR